MIVQVIDLHGKKGASKISKPKAGLNWRGICEFRDGLPTELSTETVDTFGAVSAP